MFIYEYMSPFELEEKTFNAVSDNTALKVKFEFEKVEAEHKIRVKKIELEAMENDYTADQLEDMYTHESELYTKDKEAAERNVQAFEKVEKDLNTIIQPDYTPDENMKFLQGAFPHFATMLERVRNTNASQTSEQVVSEEKDEETISDFFESAIMESNSDTTGFEYDGTAFMMEGYEDEIKPITDLIESL